MPEHLPAIVGFPSRPPRDLSKEYQNEQIRQLQEVYRQRLKEKSAAGQSGSPAVTVSKPGSDKPPPGQSPPKPAPPPRKTSPSQKDSLDLRFTNAPIDSVINSIMQELGYSYVIDPQVTGSVNLFTAPGSGIKKEQLFEVLEQILKMNGHAIIKQKDLYVIVPIARSPKIPHQILVAPTIQAEPSEPVPSQKEGGKEEVQEREQKQEKEQEQEKESSQLPENGVQEVAGESATAETPPLEPGPRVIRVPSSEQAAQIEAEQGVITYIIPLHYINSTDMVKMISAFITESATVIDFTSTNMLIITDYRKNIQQVLNLVNMLDIQYFDLNSVDLVTIVYNQATDIAEDLSKVFSPGDKAGGVRFVAIERLNSILVVTHASSVLAEVKKWIGKLDAPSSGSNVKTFVYEVENSTATNIAEVLAQLYQDGTGLPSGPSKEGEQQAQAQRPTREAGFLPPSQRGPMAGIRSELGPALTGRPGVRQAGVRAVVSGNVKIIVNEFNNSLIIQATEADYQFLLQTIRQLDVLPRQVILEARIYAVELRDELSFGVSAFLRERGSTTIPDPENPGETITVPTGGSATTGEISAPSGESPGGALRAATRAFIGLGRQLDAIIVALSSKTNVELLEAPRLLATDGMQATINVGAEVPVTTSSFGDPLRSGSAGAFINSIQFRPTGTTLLILPRISASGIVTMDLAIEVSSAVGQALTPTINRNYVETSVIVRDGQTLAIAGIISDQFDTSRNRVPLLGNIPIIGALFGQTSRNRRRFELIFLITPYVVRTLPTAAELTLEFKRALRNAYEFIERKEAEREELIRRRREEEITRESEQQ